MNFQIDTSGNMINIGNVRVKNPVFLAPMTGISDLPFRKLADKFGAGLVVSEMVASEFLHKQHTESVRKIANEQIKPFVIQLVGREARWMALGAKMAEDAGADIIDINMGCPAKKVTRGLSGSALMREPKLALEIIEAVVGATSRPVTLKMRMGWDEKNLNAPQLARASEAVGVQMITIHGRTRNQFYDGAANWSFITEVKKEVNIPVIVNGDITELADIKEALASSGADGVMIGRGAQGAPWFPGRGATWLRKGEDPGEPAKNKMGEIVLGHYHDILELYGVKIGMRNARKHLGWYIERMSQERETAILWKQKINREECHREVMKLISEFYHECAESGY